MELDLQKEILFILLSKAQDGKGSFIESDLLKRILKNKSPDKELDRSEFYRAIGKLIDERFIEQVGDCYRITPLGKERGRPDTPAKPLPKRDYLNLVIVMMSLVALAMCSYLGSHQSRTIILPLSSFMNQNGKPLNTSTMNDWVVLTPGQEVEDSPFRITPKSLVIQTESQGSGNHFLMELPVNLQDAVRLHLLVNLMNSAPNFTRGERVLGKEICRIWLNSSGKPIAIPLIAGKDIRDLSIAYPGAVSTVSEDVKTIWKGPLKQGGENGVIDYIVRDIPEAIRALPHKKCNFVK